MGLCARPVGSLTAASLLNEAGAHGGGPFIFPSGSSISTLGQATATLGRCRSDYNGSRPQSALGWQTPSIFAATSIRDGFCRCARPKAPRQISSLTRPTRPNSTVRTTSPLDRSGGNVEAGRFDLFWQGKGQDYGAELFYLAGRLTQARMALTAPPHPSGLVRTMNG